MESPPPTPAPPLLQPPIEADDASTANPNSGDSNLTVEKPTKPFSPTNATAIKKKMKNKKKRKDVQKPHLGVSFDPPQQSLNSFSSSSSTFHSFHPRRKGIRLSTNRRNPRVLSVPFPQRHDASEADAIALPLGMSIAAFVAQVLEKKEETGEKMSIDHLSQICTLAVKESLSNVFGNKFDCFVRNFERSFQSTLMTLRVISETSENRKRSYPHGQGSSASNFHSHMKETTSTSTSTSTPRSQGNATIVTEYEDPVCNDLAVLQDSRISQQLTCVPPNQLHMVRTLERSVSENELAVLQDSRIGQQLTSVPPNHLHMVRTLERPVSENELAVLQDSGISHQLTSVPSNQLHIVRTLERSLTEQTRSNDLKAFELSLTMQKIKLKEAQIAVNCDSNYLEKFKLSMGISKAKFKAEKFKTELEDSRHAQLLKKCGDCLVAGLLIMLAGLAYGTYIHSHERLIEATESCIPTKGSSSWWMPKQMASVSSGLQILRCQVQVISRMLFGVLMIIAITYLLIQRSGTTNQTMPVTFILLLLGCGCGFAGKFCIDTLGGSGNHWLLYWELLCFIHFLSNVWTSMVFSVLHGPVAVTVDQSMSSKLFPYWLRRWVFYAMVLVYLPLLCGLIPFAGPVEWLEHFGSLVIDRGLE